MLSFRVDSHVKNLSNLTNRLGKKQVAIATSHAINRTLVSAKGVFRRSVQQEYKIPSSELNYFEINKSNSGTLTGTLGVRRRPLSLAHFNPRFTSVSSAGNVSITVRRTKAGLSKISRASKVKKPAKGVSFEVKKGERKTIAYAFMTKNDSEKPVFARGDYRGGNGNYDFIKGKERLPITKLLSTSVAGAAKNPEVQKNIDIKVTDTYTKRLLHELNYQISKL